MKNPKCRQADCAAGGINKNVGNHRRAGGNEPLVKFIGAGVEKNNEQCSNNLGGKKKDIRLIQQAENQQRENGVFGQMRAFAQGMMDLSNPFL
jgi:hypothetical protein